MRLFIAVNLTQEIKEELIDLQNDWYDEGVRGNYSPEENLHLTLAFIGEYPDPKRVADALKSVTFAPFPITIEGVGAFDDLWWAGLEHSPALGAVAKQIRRALGYAGIPFDKKKFSPHITLLRRASAPAIPPSALKRTSMTVDTISLMRSERGKIGMIYTEIDCIRAEKA